MKFSGYTDSVDFHWRTLLAMACDRSCWNGSIDWRDWGFGFDYTWYDGPIFQLRLGPIWLGLIY